MPIVASCALLMPLPIRGFPVLASTLLASMGNRRQEKLCGFVLLCRICAKPESCAESVRADTGSESVQFALSCLRYALSVRVAWLGWGPKSRTRSPARHKASWRAALAPAVCSRLASTLSAQERALHARPIVKAAPADLDVGKDSLRFPITQGPTANWQLGQQLFFVNEVRQG